MSFLRKGLLVLTLLIPPAWACAMPKINNSPALQSYVTQQRENLGLVGLGVMVMRDGEIVASAVAGERKHRSGVLLTAEDKWHIGSITKSITATVIARLVERDELSWNTTIGDVLGDSMQISDSWQGITLEQLLTHTSGASNRLRPSLSSLFRSFEEGAELVETRNTVVEKFMVKEPVAPPGSQFLYSNGGFVIAGVMAEKLTGLSWEDLVRREIFTPLGIKSGGFGHPQDPHNKIAQPYAHKKTLGFLHAKKSDPVVLIGPAGSIHMTMADLLLYAKDHLAGKAGSGKLLKPETYQKLHTPMLDNYAFGWVVHPVEKWANGPVIWHNGSNGYWYTLLALMLNSNTIIVVASNDGKLAFTNDMGWPLLEGIARLIDP